jgi:predicted RND superfamily exporter protein
MWQRLAKWVLKNRLILLLLLFAATVVMAFFAAKIKMSYEFSKAIPADNLKYQDYLSFKEKFGDD